MAYYGRQPARVPAYNISGSYPSYPSNQRGAYLNQGFYGRQTPSVYGRQQQPVTPPPTSSSNRTLAFCILIGVIVFVVALAIVGIVLGVVFANRDNGGTTDPQPTQATQAPLTQPTQAPQTQAPQTQPTQAPQTTQATQPQTTQATQPQTTAAPGTIEGDIFNTGICGTRPVLANRIVGGTNAVIGHWPWMGSLRFGSDHNCGATLLNSRWAVTAAHCVVDGGVDPTSVVFGITDFTNPGAFQQETGFDRIINHPNYDPNADNAEFDITLLQLTQTITFNNYVRPLCLATNQQETSVYSNCHGVGWGALSDPNQNPNAQFPDILQQVFLPLTSSTDCDAIASGVTSNIICAGGTPQGGTDTCQGDSGGPLACASSQDSSWHLVGVVSTGDGCALPATPGFYTRISQFITWIQTNAS